MRKNNIQTLVLSGVLAALVFAVTSFTKIPLVGEAYFHAGDSIIFLAATLLGPLYGALVSGVGSFFADLYLGSPQYMLATLVIKGVMGAIAGCFLHPRQYKVSALSMILGLSLSSIWMAVTYYLYEVIILGINLIANIPGLGMNLVQGGLGVGIYLLLAKIVTKSKLTNRSI